VPDEVLALPIPAGLMEIPVVENEKVNSSRYTTLGAGTVEAIMNINAALPAGE
jgi:hypothetical protein